MSVINASGRIVPVVNIILDEVLEDGTVKHITHEIKQGLTYKFIVYSSNDGMLYTVIGKLKDFGKNRNYISPENKTIDWITIDRSEKNHSKIVRILISNIRSIELIKELN